jgi:hypothetical protein
LYDQAHLRAKKVSLIVWQIGTSGWLNH